MSKIAFIAERGNPGADGTALDLAGLGLPERALPLCINFDSFKAVAMCSVSKTASGLLVEADVPSDFLDFYPAIGFAVLKSQQNENGAHTITSAKLLAVSLSATPNSDPAIKSVREQQGAYLLRYNEVNEDGSVFLPGSLSLPSH
jgi:hypothetical protein